MLNVVAKIQVKAGAEETVKEIARELVKETRLEEGNISYSFNENIRTPGEFAFVEIWTSQEAIDFHKASPHFTTLFPKINEYAIGSPVISIYSPFE